MTTKSRDPSEIGSIFSSGEVAQQWQSGKAQRDKVNAAANEMMLDAANLRPGNRVLDVAAGTGDQTLMAASTRWTDGLRISDGYFCQHAQARVRCGTGGRAHERRDPGYGCGEH